MKFILAFLFTTNLFFFGCQATKIESLTSESRVQKSKAVVIVGIKWREDYLDIKKNERVTVFSDELDQSADLVKKKSVIYGENRLKAPLYYIYKQTFFLEGENHRFAIQKFYNSLRDYKNVGIYGLDSDTYSLRRIYQNELRFSSSQTAYDRWYPFRQGHSFPEINWSLEAGNVYYLGNAELFFNTKKINAGLFPPEMVNGGIGLTRVRWTDDWETVKQRIKKDSPWLPVDSVINLAKPADLVRSGKEWKPYREEPKADKKKKDPNLFW